MRRLRERRVEGGRTWSGVSSRSRGKHEPMVLVDPRVKGLVVPGPRDGRDPRAATAWSWTRRSTRGGRGPFLLPGWSGTGARARGPRSWASRRCSLSRLLPTVRRPVERQRPAGASSVREATTAAGQVRTWVTRLGFVKMSGPTQALRLAQTTIGLSRMVRRSGSGCRAQTVPGAYRHVGLHLLERREHAPTTSQQGFRNQQPIPRDVDGAIDLAPVDTNSAMPTAS